MVTEINLGGLNINAGECWYPDLVDNLPSFLFITYLMHSKAQKLGSVTGSIEVTRAYSELAHSWIIPPAPMGAPCFGEIRNTYTWVI